MVVFSIMYFDPVLNDYRTCRQFGLKAHSIAHFTCGFLLELDRFITVYLVDGNIVKIKNFKISDNSCGKVIRTNNKDHRNGEFNCVRARLGWLCIHAGFFLLLKYK